MGVTMQQQYKVHNTIFPNIEEATYYVSMLSATAQATAVIEPYTPPNPVSQKLSTVRNMLIRDMLNWAGSFTKDMSPSVDEDWMYSWETDEGDSDAGDCYYEDIPNVKFGENLMWVDAVEDFNSAVENYGALLCDYSEYNTEDSLSVMLNNMYHVMSDHSSETDTYIGEIRHSIEQFCANNPNIAHSYDHPTRTTTISFSGNVDAMYEQWVAQRSS